jgi:hypothetical protein
LKKVTDKQIATNIKRVAKTIVNYKKEDSEMYTYLKLGAYCKENGINDLVKLKNLLELKEKLEKL